LCKFASFNGKVLCNCKPVPCLQVNIVAACGTAAFANCLLCDSTVAADSTTVEDKAPCDLCQSGYVLKDGESDTECVGRYYNAFIFILYLYMPIRNRKSKSASIRTLARTIHIGQ
jgi:hypothetical protein